MSRVGDEVHRTMPALTMSEKILAKASGNESVRPGQIVDGSVDLLYMHEMLAMALIPFGEIGTAKVWDPTKIVVTLDHWVPPPTPEIAKMHQTIRDFCRRQGIQRFHDVGDHGIVHQLIAERGYAHPWDLVIGSDSHTNMVGAVGAFAAGIGATDTAAVMATGRLWLRVPETLRVQIPGTPGRLSRSPLPSTSTAWARKWPVPRTRPTSSRSRRSRAPRLTSRSSARARTPGSRTCASRRNC